MFAMLEIILCLSILVVNMFESNLAMLEWKRADVFRVQHRRLWGLLLYSLIVRFQPYHLSVCPIPAQAIFKNNRKKMILTGICNHSTF